MSFGGWVMYITPSTTSGEDSSFSVESAWNTHFISRCFAFADVIWVSGLCRHPLYPPEYISQFCGSRSVRKRRSPVTCARSSAPARQTRTTPGTIPRRRLIGRRPGPAPLRAAAEA